ncbi:MAG TPA: iron ABC transporter permease, partial [Blastocatellia bacterium]|nr:iron ABC transporter permease [Blastocatellia bacterium]
MKQNLRYDLASAIKTGRLTQRRLLMSLALLVALLIFISAAAVAVGSEHIPAGTILRIIWSDITGTSIDATLEQRIIIADIRLPRVIMAILVGAALSVAGASYQALLRNPLADPYILGVSTGAALGAIAATVFAESIPVGRPLAAFTGAVLAIMTVYFLGQGSRRASTERLILAGVITNTFLSSVVIFLLTAASGSRLRSVFSWLIGDLNGEIRLLPIVAVFIIAAIVIIYVNARSLNLMMTGEQEAKALGVEVERVKVIVYLASSLITGAAVAASGVIGFVG